VTRLRKLMLEELQRLNYSEETIRSYIHAVEDFSRRFNCPPDRLGPRHIREYQAELFQKRKLSPGSVAVRLAALRFFYTKTLRRAWSVADTPYPKRIHQMFCAKTNSFLTNQQSDGRDLARQGAPRATQAW
jgi:integrase/recombinase XerD